MSLPILLAKKKFTPRRLFAAGEQGVWYDPSDFSTMFQDAAGTTPVTAIEQPVGLILDKSGRGNHASQSPTTSRPILRNLYNQLKYTEALSNTSQWEQNRTVTADNQLVDGILCSKNTGTGADGLMGSWNTISKPVNGGATPVISILLHRGSHDYAFADIGDSTFANVARVWVNLNTGTIDTTVLIGSASFVGTPSIVAVTGFAGWYKLTFSANVGSTNICTQIYPSCQAVGNVNYVSGAYGYATQASIVPANEAHLPYQRVTTGAKSTTNPESYVTAGYDTDTTKFPPYLFFDGADDWLETPSFAFGSDKLSIFAGVRRLVNQDGTISSFGWSGNGSFALFSQLATAYKYYFGSGGTSFTAAFSPDFGAPVTSIVTGSADIAGDYLNLRVNGLNIDTKTADQGTSNYGTYALRVGLNTAGTTFFNGRLYSLIIRSALTSSPQLEQTERWVAAKTGVTL